MDSPSGRVPERAPDWFLVATEACGGGTPDLGFFLGVSEFIGIYGGGITSVGPTRRSQACPAPPRGVVAASGLVTPSWLFWPSSKASGVSFGPKKIIVKFHSIWTPSEKGSKTRKKQKLALGTELIG